MRRNETTLLAVTIALVEFVHGALLFVLLPTMLRARLGWAMGTTGAAVSTYFFAEIALKLVAGWMVDKLGTRRVMVWGFWIYLAAYVGLIAATRTWEVFLMLAVMGAGASPLWPAALTRLTATDTSRHVGGELGHVFSTWFLGGGLGVGLGTLMSRSDHPISMSVFALPLLAAAVLGMMIPPSPAAERKAHEPAARPPLPSMLRSIAMLATSLIPQIIAAGILIPIVVPYLEIVRGLTEHELFLLMVLGPGVSLALMARAGRMTDRLGRRTVYGIALGAVAVLLLLIPFCRTLWLLALDFVGIGIGYAFVLPAWNSILLRLLPKDVRGAGLGLAMTIEGMGGVVGPLVGGLLWQWTNPSSPFYLSGGLLLIAAGASTQWRIEAIEG